MSTAGHGVAHVRDYGLQTASDEQIFERVREEGLAGVVAQNVTVEVRPAPEVELLGILNEYPAFAIHEGLQLELGDAYGGERRRVIFALHIPHLAALGPAKVAEVILRYVSVGEEIAEHTVTIPVMANLVSADEAGAAQPDLEVREEVVVLRAARARNEAIRLADTGDHEAARAMLLEAAEEARPLAPTEADALLEATSLMSVADYDPSVRKRLWYESNALRRRGPRW